MKIISHSVNETLKIGRRIAKGLKEGDILCLFGNLGSGKTVFTKGLATGLKIKSDKVISPSFVLIRQHYQGSIPLFHFDLYRLKDPQDIPVLGYEEYFYGRGITVIEWAERLGYLLPKECLRINLSIRRNSQRLLEINAFGSRYKELLSKIYKEFKRPL